MTKLLDKIYDLCCLSDELDGFIQTDYRTLFNAETEIREVLNEKDSFVKIIEQNLDDVVNSAMRMGGAFDDLKAKIDELFEERKRVKGSKIHKVAELLEQLDDRAKDEAIDFLIHLQEIQGISKQCQDSDRRAEKQAQ